MIAAYLDHHPDESPDGMLIEVQNRLAHLNHFGQKKDDNTAHLLEGNMHSQMNSTATTNSTDSSDHNNSMESNTNKTMALK
jgi:hypothetical protein